MEGGGEVKMIGSTVLNEPIRNKERCKVDRRGFCRYIHVFVEHAMKLPKPSSSELIYT